LERSSATMLGCPPPRSRGQRWSVQVEVNGLDRSSVDFGTCEPRRPRQCRLGEEDYESLVLIGVWIVAHLGTHHPRQWPLAIQPAQPAGAEEARPSGTDIEHSPGCVGLDSERAAIGAPFAGPNEAQKGSIVPGSCVSVHKIDEQRRPPDGSGRPSRCLSQQWSAWVNTKRCFYHEVVLFLGRVPALGWVAASMRWPGRAAVHLRWEFS
jgi:hypothetical protein